MTQQVLEFQRNGHEVLVSMDANSDINDPKSKVSMFVKECNLADPISLYNPQQSSIETVKEGKTRIDIILTSRKITRNIVSIKYMMYDVLTQSDHRAIELIIKEKELFGNHTPDRTHPLSRRLSLNSPTKVKKYEETLSEQITKHKILPNVIKINEIFQHDIKTAITRYEGIAEQIARAQRHAEKQCGKLQYGHAWSPLLVEAGFSVIHWKSIIFTIRNKTTLSEKTKHNHKLIDTNIKLPCDYKLALYQLKKARKKLKEIQKHALDLRDQFLEDRAKFYAERNNRTTSKIINQIRYTENCRALFKKIKWTLSDSQQYALDHVLIQNDDGMWRRTVDDKEMYDEIIKTNMQVLKSAQNKLPGSLEMREFIGDYGEKIGVMHLLNGNKEEISEYFDEQITEMLAHFKAPNHNSNTNRLIDSEVTEKELRNLLKKTRESTASSPSGLHMGHYKVGATMKDMCAILSTMISIPLIHGFSPQRWQNSIHVMLEKIEGQPRIDKLRIIQLLEADFNIALKIKIGRSIMYNAERNQTLGNQMHGGRRGNSTATELSIQKLTHNITKQTRRCMVSMNLDATKCYDRIFPNLGGIALSRLGLTSNFRICIAKH